MYKVVVVCFNKSPLLPLLRIRRGDRSGRKCYGKALDDA